MIDLHSHILPGLDDGVASLEESVELARLAAAEGVDAIAATPHVRDDHPTTADAMERALAEVRAAVEAAGVTLSVLPGGEVALGELARRDPAELRRFGLGGSSVYLLVETPYFGWPLDIEERLFHLRAAGLTPVLAHPERNAEVQEDLDRVGRLVETGTLVQVTASSLDGRSGKRARATALALVSGGLAHLVASDAHAPDVRRGGLRSGLDALGDEVLGRWLTTDVPVAIVAGRELPPRPEQQRRSGRARRLRRFGRS